MQSGKLRRRISIEAPSTTQDGFGQPVDTDWQPVLSTWAAIRAITGKEVYALGAGFTSKVTQMITMRFPSATVSAGMRVVYESRIFLIVVASDPTEDKRELDLVCLEDSK
jgi:SPP1 family predicted phage head-tail adaptor